MYEKSDRLTTLEAIEFLKEQGFPFAYQTIMDLSSKGKIPRQKFGRNLVFSKLALSKWVEKRLTEKEVVCL
jgi:hypothetical protein